jgi:pimeloyl-ACP methyl ester carboxylesterase
VSLFKNQLDLFFLFLKNRYQGTKDFTVPLRYAHQIDSTITDKAEKKMVIVNGAGHDLTISHPKEVCEALVALLSGKGWGS